MARLPYIDGDKGNWGEILNTWLKHVAGYKGAAPAKPANGNLPAGVAVNGNGYGTNDQYQSDNSGLNFHNDFPANAPDGFTFIHTVHNRIYRKEGNGWAVLLEGGVGSSQTASDSDWYEVGTSNPPNNISDDIYTSGNVAIGKLEPASGVRLDVNGKTATDTIQIKGPSAGVNKILVSNDTAGNAVWKNTSELLGTLTVQPISNSSSVITVNPSTFNPSNPTAQTIGIGLTGGNENQIIIRTQNGYNWTNPSTLRPLLDLGTLTLSVQPSSASVLSINPNTNPNYNPANNSNQGIQVGLTGGQPNQVIYRTPDQNNPYQWRNPEELIPRGSLVAGNLINFAGDPSNRLIGSGDLTINAVSQTLSTASIQNNGGATINLSGNGGSVRLIHGTATQVVRNNDGTIQINVTDATDRILQRGSLVAGNQVTLSGPLTNRLIGSGDVTINHATINTTSSTTPGTIQAVTSLGINNGHVTSITNSGINAGNGISITQSGGTYTISNTAPNQNDADWFVENSTNIPNNIDQNIWTNGRVGIQTNNPWSRFYQGNFDKENFWAGRDNPLQNGLHLAGRTMIISSGGGPDNASNQETQYRTLFTWGGMELRYGESQQKYIGTIYTGGGYLGRIINGYGMSIFLNIRGSLPSYPPTAQSSRTDFENYIKSVANDMTTQDATTRNIVTWEKMEAGWYLNNNNNNNNFELDARTFTITSEVGSYNRENGRYPYNLFSVLNSGDVIAYRDLVAINRLWIKNVPQGNTDMPLLVLGGNGIVHQISASAIGGGDADWSGPGVSNTNNGNIYRTAGNVGIGTSSPQTRLQVVTNVDASSNVINLTNLSTNANASTFLQFGNNSSQDIFVLGIRGANHSTEPNNAFVWNRADAAIRFGTNNTQRMVIWHDGKISVNTDHAIQNRFTINTSVTDLAGLQVNAYNGGTTDNIKIAGYFSTNTGQFFWNEIHTRAGSVHLLFPENTNSDGGNWLLLSKISCMLGEQVQPGNLTYIGGEPDPLSGQAGTTQARTVNTFLGRIEHSRFSQTFQPANISNCNRFFINCFSAGGNENAANPSHRNGYFYVTADGRMFLSRDLRIEGTPFRPGGGTWVNPSDARIKTNIQPLFNSLKKIIKLQPAQFDWINPEEHKNEVGVGFIAQDLEKVFPECVQEIDAQGTKDGELTGGKTKTVGLTNSFFAHLVQAIKEQQQMIEQQKAMIEDLQKQINELKKNK